MDWNLLWGPLSALAGALVWGGADFSGGQATRRISQYQVLVLSGISGGVVLLLLALLRRETLPSGAGLFWSLSAGLCGALGLAMLYRGLSLGNTALVAPVAAVIGALLPVLFDLLQREPPRGQQWLGFGLALLGIWLVTQSGPSLAHLRRVGLGVGLAAGAAFGAFFSLISRVAAEPLMVGSESLPVGADPVTVGAVFAPLFISRCATLALALLAGVLDAGGNIFDLLATYLTRLDVAAVLSSLYPAVTVLLAAWLTQEKMTRLQWAGLAACLGAVMLITGVS